RIVDPNLAVGTGRGECAPRRAVGNLVNAGLCLVLTDGRPRRRRIPEAQQAVVPAGNDRLSVRAVCHGMDRESPVAGAEAQLAVIEVMDVEKPFRAGRGDVLAIGTEGNGGDLALVSGQRAQVLARLRLPHPDVLVLAARGNALAVGTDRD